ncbi:DDE family endonuclease [Mycena sanguinolenta]|uniref:DDE family endonuclease n=1 Tax=Mycena sanguinolenta TaxID=230812 RepID=A0A8H6XM15_9AGAR|nr:DDE family endonuclease [Mycena sanguinolenta]
MPKGPPKRSKMPRGPGGMFLSAQSHPNTSGSSDENENIGSSSDSDTVALESDFELEEDPDYTEDWEGQPQPTTFEERKKMNEEKRAKIAAKKRNAEIRGAEHRLAGPVDNLKALEGYLHALSGDKSKKLKDNFKNGTLKISHEELQRQLEAIKSQGSSGTPEEKQRNIADMFGRAQKRPRAASILSEDDIQKASGMSSGSGRSKRLKIGLLHEEEEESSSDDDIQEISGMSSAPVPEEEEESSSSNESEIVDEVDISPEELESAARQKEGDAAVDSIAIADDIAEWVYTILEDAAPLEPDQLQSLASDGLKAARKKKDYRSTVLFAALVDFYRWMPRMGRLRAALRIAKNHGRGPAFQRVLCAQARFFEANGSLKPSYQGQREKHNGLLDDEGFYLGVLRWLRTLEVGTVNPKLLQKHVNETLLPSLALKKNIITIRQCQRWLWKLGYRRKRHTKGVYWDGHERKDVKQRRKAYLAELEAFEPFRSEFAEPDMVEVMPELGEDDVEHVVIVHDEATVHSNDYDGNHYWLKEGEQVLKKKGRGRLIMISAFLCERYGLLALTEEMVAENEQLTAELRLAITDSTTVIYPDNKAGGDAYWNMQQMIEQLIKAILIARRLFPKAIIHWVFDNSSAHGSLAKDALTATKMNVNPGGKVPEMRDTIIPSDNPHGKGGQSSENGF